MILLKNLFLIALGLGSGLLVSAGVFTVLLAIGLAPRYAGKTQTAAYIWQYENCIVWGTIVGTFFSIFPPVLAYRQNLPELKEGVAYGVGIAVLLVMGIFIGIFVGTLSIAIAEMFDSIPIFTRRAKISRGIYYALTAIAVGKMAGSLFYYWNCDSLFNG